MHLWNLFCRNRQAWRGIKHEQFLTRSGILQSENCVLRMTFASMSMQAVCGIQYLQNVLWLQSLQSVRNVVHGLYQKCLQLSRVTEKKKRLWRVGLEKSNPLLLAISEGAGQFESEVVSCFSPNIPEKRHDKIDYVRRKISFAFLRTSILCTRCCALLDDRILK